MHVLECQSDRGSSESRKSRDICDSTPVVIHQVEQISTQNRLQEEMKTFSIAVRSEKAKNEDGVQKTHDLQNRR